jgi:ribonuclease D
LRDEAVIEIAAHAPRTVEALARTRGLPKGVAEGRLGRDILDAVAAGLADPDPPPAQAQKAENPPGLGPLIELLRVLLKQRCEDFGVAQKLVASADDIEAIAADDNADIRALAGWRREVFGADALSLKHGKLALTAGRNRIELVSLEQKGEAA